MDFTLVPKKLWRLLKACFGADYTIEREKDSVKSGFFRAEYRIFHDDHLKLLILPPLDQITEETLADIGKPIKVYYS